MDYCLFLKVADTCGKLRCPMQAAYELQKFGSLDAKHKDSFCIVPDEPVTAFSAVYTGLTESFLEKNSPRQLQDAVSRISTLIRKVSSKNIYIAGWNILEDTLDVLDSTAKRLHIDSFDKSCLKTIDIKRFAERSLPIDELGRLGPDTALFWLSKSFLKMDDAGNLMNLRVFQQSRWQNDFCEASICIDKTLLSLLMQKHSLKTLDDVYAWLEAPKMLEVFTFGKHKGEKIADVYVKDNEYLCWLRSCRDLMAENKDLAFTLEVLLNN